MPRYWMEPRLGRLIVPKVAAATGVCETIVCYGNSRSLFTTHGGIISLPLPSRGAGNELPVSAGILAKMVVTLMPNVRPVSGFSFGRCTGPETGNKNAE